MIERIKEFFGVGSKWKSLMIESQEIMLKNLTTINTFSFLKDREIADYKKPLEFLSSARKFVDHRVVIHDSNNEVIIIGRCIGFGTLINNVIDEDPFGASLLTKIKRFYAIKKDSGEEEIITIDNTMTIDLCDISLREK